MYHQHIVTTKRRTQVVDITPELQKIIDDNELSSGLCHVFIQHTTAAITTADLDPGTDLDMLDAIEAIAPKLNYRHPHNPEHAPDHIMSSLIGPDVFVPVKDGTLQLGTWQRIVIVELDGPRERSLFVSFILYV